MRLGAREFGAVASLRAGCWRYHANNWHAMGKKNRQRRPTGAVAALAALAALAARSAGRAGAQRSGGFLRGGVEREGDPGYPVALQGQTESH